jgi:hypothetical protein
MIPAKLQWTTAEMNFDQLLSSKNLLKHKFEVEKFQIKEKVCSSDKEYVVKYLSDNCSSSIVTLVQV